MEMQQIVIVITIASVVGLILLGGLSIGATMTVWLVSIKSGTSTSDQGG